MLARRVQEEDEANGSLLEEQRDEEKLWSLGETWWPHLTRRPPEDGVREPRLFYSTRLPTSLIKLAHVVAQKFGKHN